MQEMYGKYSISRASILCCFWLVLPGCITSAQQQRFGSDSLQCLASLSVMSEFAKMKLYDNAYDAWVYCFTNCPSASRNIYLMGTEILRHKIEALRNSPERENLIDTLMLLYDKRIQYFGQEGFVTGRKGLDLLRYRPAELEKAYSMLLTCTETEGEHTEGTVLVNLMQASSVLHRNGKMEALQLVDTYLTISGLLERPAYAENASAALVRENLDRIFLSTGAAGCDALDTILLQLLQQQDADTARLLTIVRLMSQQGCSSPSLARASGMLLETRPSAAGAAELAGMYAMQGNYTKALEYFTVALELEDDAGAEARIYYQMSIAYQQQGEFARSRDMALNALANKADMGEAFLAIGVAYASSAVSCGNNTFEQGAVFWAAVDQFSKAKQADPLLAAKADELISRFTAYFPDTETAFFYGYVDGDSYSVGCWINEETRVRTRRAD